MPPVPIFVLFGDNLSHRSGQTCERVVQFILIQKFLMFCGIYDETLLRGKYLKIITNISAVGLVILIQDEVTSMTMTNKWKYLSSF